MWESVCCHGEPPGEAEFSHLTAGWDTHNQSVMNRCILSGQPMREPGVSRWSLIISAAHNQYKDGVYSLFDWKAHSQWQSRWVLIGQALREAVLSHCSAGKMKINWKGVVYLLADQKANSQWESWRVLIGQPMGRTTCSRWSAQRLTTNMRVEFIY